MLTNINLDDEKFSRISETGKEQIPDISPEWTDFNAHDPGITFLELLSWKKEIVQYRMNRIGERHRRKYLELLGGKQKGIQEAQVLLHIPCAREILLPEGTAFYADDICFETVEEEYLSKYNILSIHCSGVNGQNAVYDLRSIKGCLSIPLFGNPAKEGNSFTLYFDGPLDDQYLQHIYFEMQEVNRNPFDDSFLPLAGIRMEILSGRGWEKVTSVYDETHEFLSSGRISFRLPSPMQKTASGYPIRFTLEEAGFETAPVLEHLGIHRVKVVQRQTLAKCCFEEFSGTDVDYYRIKDNLYRQVRKSEINPDDSEPVFAVRYASEFYEKRLIGPGTGFPFQSYNLELPDLSDNDFRLLVETMPESGYFEEWELVDHLDASAPEDRHFTLEDDTITFGDGYHGRMPEGEIRIISCHTSKGEAGNVRANAITICEGEQIDYITHEAASGGCGRESIEDAISRGVMEMEEVHTAVTLKDYEVLAAKTPGLSIKTCAASVAPEGKNRIILSVAGGSRNSGLSEAYLKNIENYMLPRIPLGTQLNVIACRYIGISVFVEVTSRNYGETVKAQVTQEISKYFEKLGENAGCVIRKTGIYELLDRIPVVNRVRSISIEAREGGALKTESGDIKLPPGGLAWFEELQCLVSSAE